MSRELFSLHAAGAAAALAAILVLQAPTAQADEISTTNCLHGYRDAYGFGSRHDYGDEYGSSRGGAYSYNRGFTLPGRSGFDDGFHGARVRGRLIGRATDRNGGANGSGSHAEAGSGYDAGYGSASGGGSSSGQSSDSCVEIRRELTNPYVIQVQPPQSGEATRAAEEHDRLWREHCHPDVKQDAHGIRRYVYSAPGCEYGKYE